MSVGRVGAIKEALSAERQGANESRWAKVAKEVKMGLKRNFGTDVGERDNGGIG